MIALPFVAALAMGFHAQGATDRGFVAGKYAIELDGVAAGWASTVHGGFSGFDVVSGVGADGTTHKQIGKPKYEDFALQVGTGMGKPFYDWIQNSFDRAYVRKSGAIHAADFNRDIKSRLAFTGGPLSEVDFPALDAAAKDAAKMTVHFQPDSVQESIEPTKIEVPDLATTNSWFKSDFLVSFPDFPNVVAEKLSRVKVQFFWDRDSKSFVSESVGNVVVVVKPAGAQALSAFFADGVKGGTKRTSVTIQYFNIDGTLSVTLNGAGISSMAPERDGSLTDTKRFRVELYCENVTFKFTPNK
jgi:hypothetical protein